MKLCLTILATCALYLTLFAPVALAQSGTRHTVQRPSARRTVCTTRVLDQGSGSVRICAAPMPR